MPTPPAGKVLKSRGLAPPVRREQVHALSLSFFGGWGCRLWIRVRARPLLVALSSHDLRSTAAQDPDCHGGGLRRTGARLPPPRPAAVLGDASRGAHELAGAR